MLMFDYEKLDENVRYNVETKDASSTEWEDFLHNVTKQEVYRHFAFFIDGPDFFERLNHGWVGDVDNSLDDWDVYVYPTEFEATMSKVKVHKVKEPCFLEKLYKTLVKYFKGDSK